LSNAFLAEQPQWRDQVSSYHFPGDPCPTPVMRPKATEAFVWWLYEHGLAERPTNIPPLLEEIRRIDP
jgi:hypothetical protein